MVNKVLHEEEFDKKLEDLVPHEHLCIIYETNEEWERFIVPFLLKGLTSGQKCGYIVDTSSKNIILELLKKKDPTVQQYVDTGQLMILDQSDAYTRNNQFDPDLMIDFLIDFIEQSLIENYNAIRVTGEMSWALRGIPGSEKIIEYEAKLNERLFKNYPIIALCQYNRNKFAPDIIEGVILTHPFLVYRNEIYQNIYYLSPDKFLSKQMKEHQISNWIENIINYKKQKKELYLKIRREGELIVEKNLAEKTNRAKSEFLANMSHELKTPMNSILGFTEIIHDGIIGGINPEQKEILTQIINSGHYLLDLINKLLEISKIESNKMDIQVSSFHVKTITAEIIEILTPKLLAKKITLESNIPDIKLVTDRLRFKQILINIIENAIQYSKQDFNIIITLKSGDIFNAFTIQGLGIDISLDEQQQLFIPFQKLDSSKDNTGLGLYFTKILVELLGGNFNIESKIGSGTIFCFTIPVKPLSQ